MSRVILIDPCKDERWDRFVEDHPFGWVCHLSGWKKVLENSFPHMKGYYLALIDENGRIQAGLPIYEVRSLLLGNRLVSIPFTTISDPLVKNEEELLILLDCTKKLSLGLKICNVEIRSLQSDHLFQNISLHRECLFKSHSLFLNNSLNDIFKSFHPSCVRRVILKAEKFQLEKREVKTFNELEEFYKLYVITRKRLGLPPQPYKFFLNLLKYFGLSNYINFSLAHSNGKAIGAIMLFKFKNRVSWDAIGVEDNYKKIGVTHYLLWKSIEEAYYDKKEIFDFGRTSVNNIGLMIFKNRWGTKVSDLSSYYFNDKIDNCFIKKEKLTRNLIQQICRISPTPILKSIGNLCYKHLG
jgi:hypothetical protein